MIDGDGNYVIVKPDKTTWNKYQEKANKSAAAQEEEARGSKEVQDKGLECPIDKRLFVDPTKTPCCQSTFCNACITNALLDEDLRCPNCGSDGVLIDDLQADTEMETKVRKYKDERESSDRQQPDRAQMENGLSNEGRDKQVIVPEVISQQDKVTHTNKPLVPRQSPQPKSPPAAQAQSKKRKAEAPLENTRKSPGIASTPSTASIAASQTDKEPDLTKPAAKEPPRGPKALTEKVNANQATQANAMFGFPIGMPGPMSMPMGMMGMMWDPTMMYSSFGAIGGMYGSNPQPGMIPNNVQSQGFQGGQSFNGNGRGFRQNARGNMNQPYRTFNASRPNPEESAYFRAPVNPHRHQNRRNIPRPTDYREI